MKYNSHGGFLSYLQDTTAHRAHLTAIFCPGLVCFQKAIVKAEFLKFSHQVAIYCKDFGGISTLKTHCD